MSTNQFLINIIWEITNNTQYACLNHLHADISEIMPCSLALPHEATCNCHDQTS